MKIISSFHLAKQIDLSTNFPDDLKRDIRGFDKWNFFS